MFKHIDKFLHLLVEVVEIIIAVVTLGAMVYMLGIEVFKMFTVDSYFSDPTHLLHNVLTIVIGLEFVSMLIDLTPANTLEVLILAIARYVIIDHTDAVSNIVCVVCIAGLFAIKKFLIPKEDMKKVISASMKHHE
ncbi:MAG: hypothetical protein IJX58_01445 [Clostridia bacterium]|nr:hypothetical protein [Clostridia bacterium]